jgi:hypothetical protein
MAYGVGLAALVADLAFEEELTAHRKLGSALSRTIRRHPGKGYPDTIPAPTGSGRTIGKDDTSAPVPGGALLIIGKNGRPA